MTAPHRTRPTVLPWRSLASLGAFDSDLVTIDPDADEPPTTRPVQAVVADIGPAPAAPPSRRVA